MNRIITKNELYSESVCGLHETLFHNANGYIGVRGCLEEGVPEEWDTMRGMYINGFYDIIPMKQAENLCNFVEEKQTMLNVADTMTICCVINGERFSLDRGEVIRNIRTLDMEKGYTIREVVWRSPKGDEVVITIKRMTSFVQLSLFTIEYSVRMQKGSGEVRFESEHIADVTNYSNPDDPRLAAESERYLIPQKVEVTKEYSMAVSNTTKSHLSMCSMVTHQMQAPGMVCEQTGKKSFNCALYEASCVLKQGEEAVLTKYTIFTDSIRCDDVWDTAQTEMKKALHAGMEYYYHEQEKYLAHFWHQSELEILGDEGMNQSVSFNMYQLLQSAAKDSHCNIAAKGLSGEGYEGHYFWDTEMFMIPFFTLTNPELSKMLMSYRYNTLDAARENAKLLGHTKGALYPWRTITGVECSGYFPSGTAQYHIDGDIAYAVIQYYLTTGDMDFILQMGEEILLETARLWLDVGNYDKDRFVIHDVTGPDEYTCMVDNNYYTNCSAKYNLTWAVRFYEELQDREELRTMTERIGISEGELAEMKRAAEHMYLPYDAEFDINPQDDSFLSKPVWNLEETPKEDFPLLLHYHPLHLYRYQVCKQADTVLAYFLYEDEQAKQTMCNSFAYYEKITTHDSSLSTCVFSIVASRLGMKEKGYQYFGDSAKLDLENTHNNTKDGIHTANMGGCYMAIINGFAGLRIKENGVSIAPFVPDTWEGYCFKFRYQGKLLRICVDRREVRVTLLEGEQVSLFVYQQEQCVHRDETVTVKLL